MMRFFSTLSEYEEIAIEILRECALNAGLIKHKYSHIKFITEHKYTF